MRERTTDAATLKVAPENTEQVFASRLWNGEAPEHYANPSQQFFDNALGTPWEFWAEWYSGMLNGTPVDWELQRRVALIEDGIWSAGPEAVALQIERIKAEIVSGKLPQSETTDLNPETGKFRVIPIPVQNSQLLSALLINISDAMEDALQPANGLSKRSSEYRKITRVITRYGDNPQQAEVTLTTVAKGLRRQIHHAQDLPESEDNLALLEAVEDGVRGIRANHPDVAANREQLALQAFKDLQGDDRELLEQAQPVLIGLSEGDMAEDFAEDIQSLINDSLLPLPSGAPKLPGADAATRLFSRTSKMALLVDKGAELHDSKGNKTVRLGMQAGGVAGMLYALVQLGLKLLGVI